MLNIMVNEVVVVEDMFIGVIVVSNVGVVVYVVFNYFI